MAPSPSLSPAQQELFRVIQSVGRGWIEHVVVKDGEPVFHQIRVVRQVDVRDTNCGPAPGPGIASIEGAPLRFLEVLADLGDGVIDRIEIESGRPTEVYVAGDTLAAPAVWLTVTSRTSRGSTWPQGSGRRLVQDQRRGGPPAPN